MAEVRWLDRRGTEIGLEMNIVIDITEPAPSGTAKARMQFTKAGGSELENARTDIDKVVLARLL